MPFHLTSTDRPLALARSLKRASNDTDRRLTLSAAQGVVAQMLGYHDWHHLAELAGSRDPSSDDIFCDDETVAERRRTQTAALLHAGFSQAEATTIADTVHPTSTIRATDCIRAIFDEAIERRSNDVRIAFDTLTGRGSISIRANGSFVTIEHGDVTSVYARKLVVEIASSGKPSSGFDELAHQGGRHEKSDITPRVLESVRWQYHPTKGSGGTLLLRLIQPYRRQIVIWADGEWVDREDFDEADYRWKSDDYAIIDDTSADWPPELRDDATSNTSATAFHPAGVS